MLSHWLAAGGLTCARPCCREDRRQEAADTPETRFVVDEPIIQRVVDHAVDCPESADALLAKGQLGAGADALGRDPNSSPQECDSPSLPLDECAGMSTQLFDSQSGVRAFTMVHLADCDSLSLPLDECAGMNTQFFDSGSGVGSRTMADLADVPSTNVPAVCPDGGVHLNRSAESEGASGLDECAGMSTNISDLQGTVESPTPADCVDTEGAQFEACEAEEADACSPPGCSGGAANDVAPARSPPRRRRARSSRRPMRLAGALYGIAQRKMQRSPSSVSTASGSEVAQSAKRSSSPHSKRGRSKPTAASGEGGRGRQPRRTAPSAIATATADDSLSPPRSPGSNSSPWAHAGDGTSAGRLGSALRRVGSNESLRSGGALRRGNSNESLRSGGLLRRGTTNESLRSGGSTAGRRALALLHRATTNESLRSWATTESAGGSSAGRRGAGGLISSEASTGTSVYSCDSASDVGSPRPAAESGGDSSRARRAMRTLGSIARVFSLGRSPGPAGRLEDNAVIIFDWDDTLVPTCWGSDDSGPETCVRRDVLKHYGALLKHVSIVEAVLRAAREVAHVCIVTLANREWMNEAAQHLLPDLNIDAIFAELDIDVRHAAVSKNERSDFVTARVIAKKKAMSKCLNQFYRSKGGKPRWNILSVGDSEIEQRALKELLKESPGKPVCKTCKFDEDPSLEQLTSQLEALLPHLQRMAVHPKDVDWTSSGLES